MKSSYNLFGSNPHGVLLVTRVPLANFRDTAVSEGIAKGIFLS